MERCQSLSCRPGVKDREVVSGTAVLVLRPGKKATCKLLGVDINTHDA